MPRSRARAVIVLLVALLALILAHGMEQGLRSHARLRAEVVETTRAELATALPSLAVALRGGDELAWSYASRVALEGGVATEFEIFEPQGRLLYARPRRAPVEHWPDGRQLERLRREHVVTLGPFSGTGTRLLSYVSFEQNPRPVVVRLSREVPAVASDLGEYRKLMLGHGIGLVALVVLAALVFRPSGGPVPAGQGALDAYEEVVHQLQERGRSLNQQHEAERDRLERAVQERAAMARAGDLTAGIVHEVRNGLATIVGHARLLEPAPEAREAARTILQECETLERVIRRFLDFIREESLEMAPFDLGRFISRVVGREARMHPGCEISMPIEELGSLTGDEDMLERAFENLVRNALEAAGSGGHVRIAVARETDHVALLIEDDGPGLDPSVGAQPRAFFSTKAGGTGLGLPIAEKIVRLHAGELRLEPVSPHGLRAWVELPQGGLLPERRATERNPARSSRGSF
jgi:signal transduction histidine kinase